jgi:hypothetical protein
MSTKQEFDFDAGFSYGRAAFAHHLRAVPVEDRDFMRMLDGRAVREGNTLFGWTLPLLEGWARGWQQGQVLEAVR